MIVDSHCHAWRRWPYQPPVPDPDSRGAVDQLLFEMDQNGVERAAVVCARIDHNPDDNDYVAAAVAAHPTRLYQIADVDCSWTDTYHTAGATERLVDAVERYALRGFTHYVRQDDDGAWFLSDDGAAFFDAASRLRQVASMALQARLQPVLRELARRFPTVAFLVHHMGSARVSSPEALQEVLRTAELPNVRVKLSGFHYASAVAWEYPYPDCRATVQALFDAYGPERLHWGSDYPVVRRAMTYQQSLEAVRTHCADVIPAAAMSRVLGDSLYELLEESGPR